MPKILIAPLNWGLGHATRCLPLGAALRQQGVDIELHWASDGAALHLLQREIKDEPIYELPPLNVSYPSRMAVVNMMLAAPGFATSWRRDAEALADLHLLHQFDLVISDNRLGFRLAGLACIVMTHQVYLPGSTWLDRTAGNWLNHRLLKRFDSLLVPDFEASEQRLAGAMSAPLSGIETAYLGPISRFASDNQADHNTSSFSLTAVLSGPEPARTKFERELLHICEQQADLPLHLVRGLPQSSATASDLSIAHTERLQVDNFLVASKLGQVLAKAQILVCRPGYTTVMDLAALGRCAIFVPTPGQPEQHQLALALQASGRGILVYQQDLAKADGAFTLLRAMHAVSKLSPRASTANDTALNQWAATCVSKLRQ